MRTVERAQPCLRHPSEFQRGRAHRVEEMAAALHTKLLRGLCAAVLGGSMAHLEALWSLEKEDLRLGPETQTERHVQTINR